MNPNEFREHFPFFSLQTRRIYLDSATCNLVPQKCITELNSFLSTSHYPSKKATHELGVSAEDIIAETRQFIARQFSVQPSQIFFSSHVSEAMSQISYALLSWANDEYEHIYIYISSKSHNSTVLPWYLVQKFFPKAKIMIVGENNGTDDTISLKRILTENRDKKVVHIIVETINPMLLGTMPNYNLLKELHMLDNVKIILDGSRTFLLPILIKYRSVSDAIIIGAHTGLLAVQNSTFTIINDDFPTKHIYLGGAGIVTEITPQKVIFDDFPTSFEPDTPNLLQVLSIKIGLEELSKISATHLLNHHKNLSNILFEELSQLESVQILGTKNIDNRAPILALYDQRISSVDIGIYLSEINNIQVRIGSACSHLLLNEPSLRQIKNVDGVIQVSYHYYTLEDEIYTFIDTLKQSLRDFSVL